MPFPLLDIAVLPLRTDRTLRAVPYVTYTLLFLNLFVYLANLRFSEYEIYQLVNQWGFVCNKPGLVTLFTYTFLHDDLIHLLGNMLVLWLVGTVLEDGIGSITFLLLYFASAIMAILLYGIIGKAFFPESLSLPLIGASGAISGVTGLAAMRYYRLRVLTFPLVALTWLPLPVPLPVPIWVPLWSYAVWFGARELINGLLDIQARQSGSVGHWAHIGGLLLGVIVALLIQALQEGKRESVLEDSKREASGITPQKQPRREVQRLLLESPHDPEVIEAMAALMLVDGEQERSRDLYLRAIPLFLTGGQRDRAATCYLNILHAFPDTVLDAREQMALATALEAMKHYSEAVQAFTLMLEHYPATEEAQTSLLRAAQICQRYLHQPEEARRLLQHLLQQYQNSPWCNMARERLQILGRVIPEDEHGVQEH